MYHNPRVVAPMAPALLSDSRGGYIGAPPDANRYGIRSGGGSSATEIRALMGDLWIQGDRYPSPSVPDSVHLRGSGCGNEVWLPIRCELVKNHLRRRNRFALAVPSTTAASHASPQGRPRKPRCLGPRRGRNISTRVDNAPANAMSSPFPTSKRQCPGGGASSPK